MMPRFEGGDLLLTTRMSNIFLRFRQPALAWDAALSQFHSERVMIQTRRAHALGEGKPARRYWNDYQQREGK
jgi:hypothetical protein